MTLAEHTLLGAGAALVFYPALGSQGSAIFWASSVLIDIDHYWEYLYRNGFTDWSPVKMFAFHRAFFPKIHRPECLGLNLFHTIEWFLVVYLLGRWLGSSAMFAVLLGMVFHLGLDLARLATQKAMFARAFSLIEYWVRGQRLERRGLDPGRLYAEAFLEIGIIPPSQERRASSTRPGHD